MPTITIGTKNPHKRQMLADIVRERFDVVFADVLPDVEEHGDSFEEIARNKAAEYSRLSGGYVIATDGGAVFPSLSAADWDPLHTKRFASDDMARIAKLLALLADKPDRTVQWHESIAVAKDGVVLFSANARAMDGVIDHAFDPANYREGIWLCSITSFPQLGGRNYFDLSAEEQAMTEDSWVKLRESYDTWAGKALPGLGEGEED